MGGRIPIGSGAGGSRAVSDAMGSMRMPWGASAGGRETAGTGFGGDRRDASAAVAGKGERPRLAGTEAAAGWGRGGGELIEGGGGSASLQSALACNQRSPAISTIYPASPPYTRHINLPSIPILHSAHQSTQHPHHALSTTTPSSPTMHSAQLHQVPPPRATVPLKLCGIHSFSAGSTHSLRNPPARADPSEGATRSAPPVSPTHLRSWTVRAREHCLARGCLSVVSLGRERGPKCSEHMQ